MTPAADRPRLPLAAEGPALALGRAHEVAGPARRVFAAVAAGRTTGPVLWITAGRRPGALHPEGLRGFLDPRRLVAVRARRSVDGLWSTEEALRSGATAAVILETRDPPALTPVRRLQLAAEAGAELDGAGPALCLILTPEGGSAAAVETRWWIDPLPGWATERVPGGGPARWRFALLRDKAGPPGAWEVTDLSDDPGVARPRFHRAAA